MILSGVLFSHAFAGTGPDFSARITKPSKDGSVEVENELMPDMAVAFAKHAGLGPLKSPFVVTGKSGVRHSFTFGFGEGPDANVVGDVVVSRDPVDETKVLSLFIKVYDVGAKHAVLCVSPALTDEAKKLSSLYKILCVEAPSSSGLASSASDALQRIGRI